MYAHLMFFPGGEVCASACAARSPVNGGKDAAAANPLRRPKNSFRVKSEPTLNLLLCRHAARRSGAYPCFAACNTIARDSRTDCIGSFNGRYSIAIHPLNPF